MQKSLHLFISVFISIIALSQPAITPAPGYYWKNTGTATYTTAAISTTPNITSGNTSFGFAGDIDPTSCASFCAGNCDGIAVFGNSLFGAAYPAVATNINCEQRAVTLTQWTNGAPPSMIPNGPNAGVVYLPNSASITILKALSNSTEGTGIGNNNLNRGKLFGGNGGSNTTKIDVTNNYDIAWKAPAFGSLANGSQSWSQAGSFTANDPGGTSYSAYNDWYVGTFGNTLSTDNVYNIPVNLISQTGGSFEVIFAATSNLSLSRAFGNADGFVEASPAMEGRAKFLVNYTIWEIRPLLPLKLTTLNAKLLTANTASISWRNEGEIANTKYFLQRSYDATNWQQIATIVDKDNSNSIGNYTFKDETINTLQKQIYYKIQMEEYGGKNYFSDIINVENNTKNNFAVVPLTQKKMYQILTPSLDRNNFVKIYNTLGQLVQQQSLTSNNQIINLQNIPNGTYYFMLTNLLGYQKTIGIMIE